MFALRERRVHVTQEDFEMACAKVCPAVLTAQRDVGTVCYLLPHLFTALLSLFSLPNALRARSYNVVGTCDAHVQVMKKDSNANVSLKKLWK
jgi:hypothetical protein